MKNYHYIIFEILTLLFVSSCCKNIDSQRGSLAQQVRKEINYQESGEICQAPSEVPEGKEPLCYTIEEKRHILEKIEHGAKVVEKIASKTKKAVHKARKVKEKITGKKSQTLRNLD